VWKTEDEDRARTLPSGTYRLRTVRIEKERDGTHWFLSSTGPPGEALAVEAGKTARLDVKAEVHFEAVARRQREGGVQLGFSIRGADGRGMSIYRDDRRVAVSYSLRAEDGSVVAEGTMNYG